jgi:hypothetical protein
MLRFKLIPTVDRATYFIKINNEVIDHGILYTNDKPAWSQREPITLEYKGITFKNSKKDDYISVSCTNAGSGREIFIQEIHVDDVEVIAEGLGVSYREDANFHVHHIVSGCSKNLNAVMTHDYSDVVIMDRAGVMGDWIVVVKQPSGHVACWDEHLYFAKDDITFKEREYYHPPPPLTEHYKNALENARVQKFIKPHSGKIIETEIIPDWYDEHATQYKEKYDEFKKRNDTSERET